MSEDAVPYASGGHCPHKVRDLPGDFGGEFDSGIIEVVCCRCKAVAHQRWHLEPLPADEYHGPHRPETLTVWEPIAWGTVPCS